jgi:hypothetical protein
MTDNIRRSIYITTEISEQINRYAAAKNITFNQSIRILLENSLDVETAKANQSVIRQYIHEEVENSIAPYMSRIEGKMPRGTTTLKCRMRLMRVLPEAGVRAEQRE